MPDIYLRSVPSDADQDDIRLYDPTVADSGSAINATLAVTLDNVTQAAEADLLIQATAAQTIADITQSASADLLVQATAAQTVEAVTQSASADLLVQATAAQTIDAVTQAAESDLLVQATLSQTIDNVVQAAEADLLVQATASQTVEPVTQAATGAVVISATFGVTIDAVTQDAASTLVTVAQGAGGYGAAGGIKRRIILADGTIITPHSPKAFNRALTEMLNKAEHDTRAETTPKLEKHERREVIAKLAQAAPHQTIDYSMLIDAIENARMIKQQQEDEEMTIIFALAA